MQLSISQNTQQYYFIEIQFCCISNTVTYYMPVKYFMTTSENNAIDTDMLLTCTCLQRED